MGRRAPGRAARALRRQPRARADHPLGAALPRLLQGGHEGRAGRRRRRAPRGARDRATTSWSSASQHARGPQRAAHAAGAVQARRQGPAVRGPADARDARPARPRRAADAADRRRRPHVRAELRRPRADRRAARPRRDRRPPRGRRSSPSAAARPTRTGCPSSCWSPGSPGSRWASCAPTASTASARARASASSTTARRSPPSRTSRSSSCATSSSRHDPSIERDPDAEAALREEIVADLDAVESLDQDRILRDQLLLIDATLRTNAFRAGPRRAGDQAALRPTCRASRSRSRTSRSSCTPSAMEGIHLRGGAIARGGLRWSDRLDFRTEVYGLMRAQMVKNAVIVPTGAKGGFYLKQPRRRPGASCARRSRRQYRRYIHALLDVTDNLAGGEVVHPEGVRVHDGDDPYLVVAADKGTATFSDTANEIAERVRLLARRRLRLRRLGRLRPQGARHHRARRLGVGQAPLPRAGDGPGARRVHRRRHRRHVRRRLRQRAAAVGQGQADRRLRPPPRLPRSRARRHRGDVCASASACSTCPSSSWADYDTGADLRGRRRLAAQREVDPAVAAGPGGARRRGRRRCRRTRSSARSCARRSTCCSTAASAPS